MTRRAPSAPLRGSSHPVRVWALRAPDPSCHGDLRDLWERGNRAGLIAFSAATLACMLASFCWSYRNHLPSVGALEKYSHALAGGAVAACGIGMVFFGL